MNDDRAQTAMEERRIGRTKVQPVTSMTPVGSVMEDPPAEADPVGATGFVFVQVGGGWANVHGRGGRLLGQTPTRVSLPAGPQTLELRPFGQPPGRRVRVNVVAGETIRVFQSVGQ